MKHLLAKSTMCVVMAIVFLAFVQKDTDPLEQLVNSIHHWSDSLPQEKISLHMDKPYYAIGNTIWFKAYVTTGSRHQLSAISGALYADLINEQDSVVKALKLPISAGMSMGNFTLTDELKEGNYRVRAYTQWMRNAGVEYFYDHAIVVVSPFDHTVIDPSSIAICINMQDTIVCSFSSTSSLWDISSFIARLRNNTELS